MFYLRLFITPLRSYINSTFKAWYLTLKSIKDKVLYGGTFWTWIAYMFNLLATMALVGDNTIV